MPYIKRKDYELWVKRVNDILDRANANTLIYPYYDSDPIYYFGFYGRKHRIAVYYGNSLIAVGMKEINKLIECLEKENK